MLARSSPSCLARHSAERLAASSRRGFAQALVFTVFVAVVDGGCQHCAGRPGRRSRRGTGSLARTGSHMGAGMCLYSPHFEFASQRAFGAQTGHRGRNYCP